MIFDLVYTLARCRKPVERLSISSLTREAILAGFQHLQPAAAYRGLRDSARCRQQADWLVGLNATRAQTLRARQAGADGVYSLGRVQTPTLALIVARAAGRSPPLPPVESLRGRRHVPGPCRREHSVILTFPVIAVDSAQTPDRGCRYIWHSATLTCDCCSPHTTRHRSASAGHDK